MFVGHTFYLGIFIALFVLLMVFGVYSIGENLECLTIGAKYVLSTGNFICAKIETE
jgi:hypothetical protein